MRRGLAALAAALVALASGCAQPSAALPSWNEGPAQDELLAFVQSVSDPGHEMFVPPAERIAVFDNDGTLWSERPAYFQLLFAVDRVRELAPEHPEWRQREPFRSAIEGDLSTLGAGGEEALLELILATHAGMTTEEFASTVRAWISQARHPTTGRRYTDMVYQPMLELLDHLRAGGFRTYIVSGGGVEFMRVFAEAVYGVPPEQVIGSSVRTRFEMSPDGPVLRRLPEIDFINDKEGKPIRINAMIGRRPIIAVGNSDGDLQMLQWTDAAEGPSFCALIHHTDEQREWAYDRDSSIGRLDQALDEARLRGWLVVDMARDWSTVFPQAR